MNNKESRLWQSFSIANDEGYWWIVRHKRWKYAVRIDKPGNEGEHNWGGKGQGIHVLQDYLTSFRREKRAKHCSSKGSKKNLATSEEIFIANLYAPCALSVHTLSSTKFSPFPCFVSLSPNTVKKKKEKITSSKNQRDIVNQSPLKRRLESVKRKMGTDRRVYREKT